MFTNGERLARQQVGPTWQDTRQPLRFYRQSGGQVFIAEWLGGEFGPWRQTGLSYLPESAV